MAKVNINGVEYTGQSIHVNGKRVIIDGVTIGEAFVSPLEVRVLEGVLGELKADGSVLCNDVTENVTAGGSVSCNGVRGNVTAGGSVNSASVGGRISAGGSVSVG